MDARTLLIALVALVLGLGAGYALGQGSSPQADGPVDELPAEPADVPARTDAGVDPALDSSTASVAALRSQLTGESAARAAAEAEAERLRTELAALKKDAEAGRLAGGATRTAGVRYGGGRYKAVLEQIDWEEAGQALSRMTPLMGEFISSRLEGRPPPPSVGDIQKYNGALVKMALKAEQEGVPGSGTNGSFTHVAIVANLVHATLKQAGLPLSEAQEQKLGTLADEFVAEDEKRLAGYGDETLALEKLLGETTLKDRFYAGVDALVTEEQRTALHPAELRGRTSFDLFSSGLVWAQRMAPQRFRDKEHLAELIRGQLTQRYGLGAEHKALVGEVVADWVAALPASLVDEEPDALELGVGAVKVARVRQAAEAQIAALTRLLQRLPADSPAAPTIRAEAHVAVPFKLPSPK